MQFFQLTTCDEILRDLKPSLDKGILQQLQGIPDDIRARQLCRELEPSLLLILSEALALYKDFHYLDILLKHIKKNPSYLQQLNSIYQYRLTIVRLHQFIIKVKASTNIQEAVEYLYKQSYSALEGLKYSYDYLMKQFQTPHKLFEKFGLELNIYYFDQDRRQYLSQVHNNKTERQVIVIKDQEFVYVMIPQHQVKETMKSSLMSISSSKFLEPKKQKCSVCEFETNALFFNLFCLHKYCQLCLKTLYEPSKYSSKCPEQNCGAKVLWSSIAQQNLQGVLSNINELQQLDKSQNSSTVIQSQILPKSLIMSSNLNTNTSDLKNLQMKASLIPQRQSIQTPTLGGRLSQNPVKPQNYHEQQQILFSQQLNDKKIEENELYPTAKQLLAQPILYCGHCLFSLDPSISVYQQATCQKHKLCFSCQINQQNQCAECSQQ